MFAAWTAVVNAGRQPQFSCVARPSRPEARRELTANSKVVLRGLASRGSCATDDITQARWMRAAPTK